MVHQPTLRTYIFPMSMAQPILALHGFDSIQNSVFNGKYTERYEKQNIQIYEQLRFSNIILEYLNIVAGKAGVKQLNSFAPESKT